MRAASLVVFSHLRWDSVFQRPHHLMTRFARSTDVYFVEEPQFDPGGARLEMREVAGNVTVCVPYTPVGEAGFTIAQTAAIAPLLAAKLMPRLQQPCVSWLYTPMATPLAKQFGREVTVYDCMDELSGFLYAPAELQMREAELMAAADLVFTGGPSLYRSKQARHARVHCFPSSVDATHFRRALYLTEPEDQRDLPRPRLGFYGVIDERIDYELLDAIAAARPQWQIVIIGPVVKVDAARLPRRANLHYPGARSYDALPHYLAGWDVCLLPFARNPATEYISPTKTLEYMAAERPIASTPIRDVVEPYRDVAYFGSDANEFIAACERALRETPEQRDRRRAAMRAIVADTSWDRTVVEMGELIDQVASAVTAAPRQKAGAVLGGNRP